VTQGIAYARPCAEMYDPFGIGSSLQKNGLGGWESPRLIEDDDAFQASLFTYRISILGALVIMTLIFGSCMIENWEWVSFQMIYALFFAILISQVEHNVFYVKR